MPGPGSDISAQAASESMNQMFRAEEARKKKAAADAIAGQAATAGAKLVADREAGLSRKPSKSLLTNSTLLTDPSILNVTPTPTPGKTLLGM